MTKGLKKHLRAFLFSFVGAVYVMMMFAVFVIRFSASALITVVRVIQGKRMFYPKGAGYSPSFFYKFKKLFAYEMTGDLFYDAIIETFYHQERN